MATSHSEPRIPGLLLFAPGMNAPSESATTATGYQEVHAREQARLVDEALRIG